MTGNVGPQSGQLIAQVTGEFRIRRYRTNNSVGSDHGFSERGKNVEHVTRSRSREICNEHTNPKVGTFPCSGRHDLMFGARPAVKRRSSVVHAGQRPVIAVP